MSCSDKRKRLCYSDGGGRSTMAAEFAREVLTRVPLADAVLSLWRWVADPLFLLSVFARHGGAGYEKESSFGGLVQLIADAL